MAEDRTPLLGGDWSIFVQVDGPNTAPTYLGCHDFGDMELADGDITLLYCPSPTRANKWDVVGNYQGESSPATFEITTTIKKQRDTIDKIKCPVPFYVLNISCGRKDVFNNWDNTAVIPYPATRTSRSWQNLAKRVPGDNNESLKVTGFSANDVVEVWLPDIGRQSIAETTALNDITFCNDEKCADACGNAQDLCEAGIVVGDAPAGSPASDADVWYTANEGQTWTFGATSPFGAAEDIASVVCFPIDKDTTRYLVARGTTDAGAPAEVAYRDAQTGAWTSVNVGSTNGQYALGPQALFALDSQNIWLVVSGGYIYKSEDGGVTWTAQEQGIVTAQNLHGIHGADSDNLYAFGAADALLRTTDGGTSWTALTATGGGVINQRGFAISKDSAWIGDSGGSLYYTTDGGTTWTERAFTGSGAGQVRGVEFANDLVGFMLHDSAAPAGTVFYTIDGGYSWRSLSTPTNSGLNSLYVCGPNLAYAVGEADSGTAVILKISVA